MGNMNQQPGRQNQNQGGNTGQRTQPHDPQIEPERDDPNQVERRTSDEGQGRDERQSGNRSTSGGQSGSQSASQSGSTDRGQSGSNRPGNP
jgi:hypothetical protein